MIHDEDIRYTADDMKEKYNKGLADERARCVEVLTLMLVDSALRLTRAVKAKDGAWMNALHDEMDTLEDAIEAIKGGE